jgi:hypothetical protein
MRQRLPHCSVSAPFKSFSHSVKFQRIPQSPTEDCTAKSLERVLTLNRSDFSRHFISTFVWQWKSQTIKLCKKRQSEHLREFLNDRLKVFHKFVRNNGLTSELPIRWLWPSSLRPSILWSFQVFLKSFLSSLGAVLASVAWQSRWFQSFHLSQPMWWTDKHTDRDFGHRWADHRWFQAGGVRVFKQRKIQKRWYFEEFRFHTEESSQSPTEE